LRLINVQNILYQGRPPMHFRKKNIQGILSGDYKIISVIPQRKKYFDIISPDDINVIKEQNLDIIIRLGFRILKGEILSASRYGIWSYHHGDNRVNRGGPAGVWEFLQSWEETGSMLQILTNDLDNGTVLYRSWAHTHRDFLNASINKYYWKSAAFLPRQVERLINQGPDKFFNEVKKENSNPHFYSNRLFKKPGNREFLMAISKKWLTLIVYFTTRILKREQWFLLYRFDKKGKLSTAGYQFKPLNPPKNRYWADPCVIFENGEYIIFFEDYAYKTNNGHISYLTLKENGAVSETKTALKRPYHLSYPFVFKHKEIFYMIPETQNNKTIELYKARNFPDEWEFVMNLMENVWACDTTILVRDGRLWMFTCMKEFEGDTCHDELFIFHADMLETTNWVAHDKNPIVSDVKKARPAGGFITIDETLFRISQNCAGAYGKSITLHEVVILNEYEYLEKDVSELLPQWNKHITRIHTLSFAKGLTVIDGFRKVSKL